MLDFELNNDNRYRAAGNYGTYTIASNHSEGWLAVYRSRNLHNETLYVGPNFDDAELACIRYEEDQIL